MLIELKSLENLPVGSFAEQNLLGKVSTVIVSPEEAKVLGLIVKLPGFLGKLKVVSMQDVVDIDKNGVTVRSLESLVDAEEIVRIDQIIKKNFNIISLKAINQKNQNLGKVSNVLFDTQTGEIVRIYIGGLFQERIFPSSSIVEIKDDQIILKDDPEIKQSISTKIKNVVSNKDLAEAQ